MELSIFIAFAYAAPVLCGLLPFKRDNSTGFGMLITRSLFNGSALRVAINNPPLNLYGNKLGTDLLDFLTSLKDAGLANGSASSPPKVVIFHSEVPNFFMWWFNYNYFIPGASPFDQTYLNTLFNDAVTVVQLLRSLPTIFIAEVDGRAAASGHEFLVQCDMTFVGPNAVLSQPEAAMGDMAGNGGNQYMVRALGMQRASEYLLAAISAKGAEAERLGWVNRAFSTSDALTEYVDGLAQRVVHIDAAALNITKASIRSFGPSESQLTSELADVQRVASTNVEIYKRGIALAGNFTTATQWTLDMLSSLGDLQKLDPMV